MSTVHVPSGFAHVVDVAVRSPVTSTRSPCARAANIADTASARPVTSGAAAPRTDPAAAVGSTAARAGTTISMEASSPTHTVIATAGPNPTSRPSQPAT